MILKIIFLIILILINGIFSATEIAYISLNKYELHKEIKKGNKKASKILNLLNDSSSFLSAIQISITLSGFLASAFAAESFASEIADIIKLSFINKTTLINMLIIIITFFLSYFTLVFGELIPKKIGIAYSKKIAFIMLNPINFVITFFKPFILILKISVDFFTNLFNIKVKKTSSEEEVKNTIVDSSLENFEKDILLNVFEFNDTTVKEAMTAIKDVISINENFSLEDLIKILRKYKFTRYPIKNNNEIIGLINVKDIIINNRSNFKIKDYFRQIPEIKSNMTIDDAFLYLRSNKAVMATVIEENKIIGIVTLEDIIEEVLGSIADEYN